MSRRALDCAEALERLDDYVDRELGPEDIAAVEAHLAVCAGCREGFAVERDVLRAIREKLGRIRLPAGLAERLSARLERDA